jgi:hypothetical protein
MKKYLCLFSLFSLFQFSILISTLISLYLLNENQFYFKSLYKENSKGKLEKHQKERKKEKENSIYRNVFVEFQFAKGTFQRVS